MKMDAPQPAANYRGSLPDDIITPAGCLRIISGADISFIEKRRSCPD